MAAATTTTAPEGENRPVEKVNWISMNDDGSLFALGTSFGFHVFNTFPLKRRFHRDWGSGVGIIEVYKRSNIVALVGSQSASRFSENKLTIWDDNGNRVVADVDFSKKICCMHLRGERIVVGLFTSVEIMNFKDLSCIGHYDACMVSNTLALSHTSELPIIAFSCSASGAAQEGVLKVLHETAPAAPAAAAATAAAATAAAGSGEEVCLGSTATNGKMVTIPAHNGRLACVALSRDGKLAATASDKGTLIRVWDTESGKLVKELRRGAEQATIWSICFSADNSLLAVSSSNGTCHIFGIVGVQNVQSMLWNFRGMLPSYFSSEWSSMKAEIPREPSVLFFSDDNKNLFVLCHNGSYIRIELNWSGAAPTAAVDPNVGVIQLVK